MGSAIEYLKLVTNAVLRHGKHSDKIQILTNISLKGNLIDAVCFIGVASMLWHRFVMKKFQALAQLMEKVCDYIQIHIIPLVKANESLLIYNE